MLDISLEKVCFIMIKAREFDAKVEPDDPDSGSNPTDDDQRDILEDFADDATYEELVDALEALNQDEMAELLALIWLGRGDYTPEEWPEVLEQARETRDENAVRYIIGIPLVSDYLEEGLSRLGFSCQEFELGRL
ncbi:MAG: DUF3775 domain-containing protein [Kiloniellales bacterium]